MRTTQFIGLTEKARNMILALKCAPVKNCTYGMFGEEIGLGVWEDKDEPGAFIYEREQCAPWSGGPMIFTRLVRDSGVVPGSEWEEDRSVCDEGMEFDYISGKMWV